MNIKNNPTQQRIEFCDNCGHKQEVYEILLANESGTADYCKDCIIHSMRKRTDGKHF